MNSVLVPSLANTRFSPDYSISQPDALNFGITAVNPDGTMRKKLGKILKKKKASSGDSRCAAAPFPRGAEGKRRRGR